MLPLFLALALTSPPMLPKVPSSGPTPPAVKGLMNPIPMGADTADLVAWSLKEMGQAVVVVEADLRVIKMEKVNTGLKVFGGDLTLFQPRLPLPTDLAPAPWMDMSAVGAPGNPAARIFPLGWGY